MTQENESGYQDPNTDADQTAKANDDVSVEESDLQNLDDSTKEKIQTIDAQKKHWRDNAIDPETGRKYKDLLAEMQEAQSSKTSDNQSSKKNQSKQDKASEQTKSDLGFAEKAWLASVHGIKETSEIGYLQDVMQNTGKDLESVVNSNYVQAELKEMREQRASDNAIPEGGDRRKTGGQDSVEYWVQRGELPPNNPQNKELRRKVVNARMGKGKSANNFTDTPIVD